RDVRKQWKRNRTAFKMKDEDVPVYPTIASQFNDPGITWMFVNLNRLLREKLGLGTEGAAPTDQAPSHVGAAHGRDAKASPSVIPSAARDLASASEQRDPSASPRDDKSGGRITNPRVDWQPHLDTRLSAPRATVLLPPNGVRSIGGTARAPGESPAHDTETVHGRDGEWSRPGREHAASSPAVVGATQVAISSTVDRSLLTLRQRYNDAINSLTSDSLRHLREWP